MNLAEPVKRTILGWQHNKPFNETVNRWREKLFPAAGQTTFEYPKDCGSTFSFTVSRAPTFAAISKKNDPAISHLEKFEHLRKQRGIELEEPPLVFCNRQAKGKISGYASHQGTCFKQTVRLSAYFARPAFVNQTCRRLPAKRSAETRILSGKSANDSQAKSLAKQITFSTIPVSSKPTAYQWKYPSPAMRDG